MKTKFYAIVLCLLVIGGCATYDLDKDIRDSFIEVHKVLVTMKDGSKVSGYVLWGFYYKGTYAFTHKKFLQYFQTLGQLDSFDLYKTFSRINDGGRLNSGYAVSDEDKLNIQANLVTDLQSLPDKLNGTRLGEYFPLDLNKEQIEVMQGRFRFLEHIADGEKTYTAVNYDSRVSRKKLHQLLLDFQKGIDKKPNVWTKDGIAKPWKVILMFIDMTDD